MVTRVEEQWFRKKAGGLQFRSKTIEVESDTEMGIGWKGTRQRFTNFKRWLMLGKDFSKQAWMRDVAESLERIANIEQQRLDNEKLILQELTRMQNKTILTGRLFLGTPVPQ